MLLSLLFQQNIIPSRLQVRYDLCLYVSRYPAGKTLESGNIPGVAIHLSRRKKRPTFDRRRSGVASNISHERCRSPCPSTSTNPIMGEYASTDSLTESPFKSDTFRTVVEISAPTVQGFMESETGNMSSTCTKVFIKNDLPLLAGPHMVMRLIGI